MKTTTKIALGIGLIGITGLIFWGINKAEKARAILSRLLVTPSGISNFKIVSDAIEFNLSITITNPTSTAFSAATSLLSIKTINVLLSDNFLASANVDINNIEIPAGGSQKIENMPVRIPKAALLYNVTDLLDYTNLIKKVGLEVEIKGMGQTFLFKQ